MYMQLPPHTVIIRFYFRSLGTGRNLKTHNYIYGDGQQYCIHTFSVPNVLDQPALALHYPITISIPWDCPTHYSLATKTLNYILWCEVDLRKPCWKQTLNYKHKKTRTFSLYVYHVLYNEWTVTTCTHVRIHKLLLISVILCPENVYYVRSFLSFDWHVSWWYRV